MQDQNPPAAFSAEEFTASMMHAVLRGTVIVVALTWGVAVFLAINKVASAYLALLVTISILVIPHALLRRGRAVLAARVFVAGGAVCATILVLLGGEKNVASLGQLAAAVIAGVVLGPRAAFWVALPCLAADLGNALAEMSGHPLPVVLPGTPLSIWAVIGIFFVITAYPVNRAMRTLREALEQLQKQLAEHRKAEEQILYQVQLIDQSADPVMAADMNRRVTYWNAAAARLFGWSREETLGKSLDEVTPFAPTGLPRERMREELARTGRFHGEIAMLTRTGSTLIIDAAINLLRNPAGEPIGTIGGLRNITERREAELAHQRSEERLRLIAETVPVGILVMDLSGRVVFANSFAIRVLGPDIGGRRYDDPGFEITDLAGTPLPEDQRPFRLVVDTGKPVSDAMFTVKRSDGQRVYLSVNAAPIVGANGELDGVVLALEDVTERRELEERYLHAQKMESLGRLAGGVSHDFNNLLTVINGYSDMLLREPNVAASQRAKIEQIAKVGEDAKELCQQLLAFSRKQIAVPVPLAANDAVRDVEKILQHLLGPDIQLIIRLDPYAGLLQAGAGQVEQVLMNLAINAHDAMPQGGRLTVATANTESIPDGAPRQTPSAPYVQLIVEDTGVGMDESTRQRIFEPFFTTKPSEEGTGLGLATVYGIVQQNGGWVRVESEVGKGTRFSLYFPRIEPRTEEASAAAESLPEGGTETVLVVEDHASVRRFLVECLEIFGYTVVDAASGGEAVDLLESLHGKVDLVITDMSMPGMSGKKLIEILEARWPGLGVLVLSGYSEEVVASLGVTGERLVALTKPVSVPELAAAIRKLLNDRKPLPVSR